VRNTSYTKQTVQRIANQTRPFATPAGGRLDLNKCVHELSRAVVDLIECVDGQERELAEIRKRVLK
jgi:hypothetical protein